MSLEPNGKASQLTTEERLAGALSRIAELEEQLAQARTQNVLLESQLRVNNLTGLTNRYGFERIKERLQDFVAKNQFTGQGCFVNIDLDGFKGVNDSHGHEVGDQVLKHFAKKLKEKVLEREVHAPNRVPIMAEPIHPSGDEYGILIVEAVAKDIRAREERRSKPRGRKKDRRGNPNRLREEIELLMDEITRELIENPLIIDGEDGPISVNHGVSFGIGTFTSPDIESIAIAEKQADELMYEAKRAAHELEADMAFQIESGQAAFLECYDSMDEPTKAFVKEIIGARAEDRTSYRKRGIPENEIGLEAYFLDERFEVLLKQLDDKSTRWLFPEITSFTAKSTPQFER